MLSPSSGGVWWWWWLSVGCRFRPSQYDKFFAAVMHTNTLDSVTRRMVLGAFRKYQIDDYLMVVVLGFYTTMIVTINIVRYTNSNLLPPGTNVSDLTAYQYNQRVLGSKLILVVEQCQCVTIWGAKLCLVAMYLRLTQLHKENIAIKALGIYIIGSFIVMDILYFGVWCQPFHEYWALPTPNRQCSAATDHLITNAVFNLSSDVLMLVIGLPMFLRLNLPWQKKVPLILVFSLGIFVILAAILNKVYSFSDPYGLLWTYWYVRESSTALLVANLPFTWTIIRGIFRIKSITGVGGSATGDYGSQTTDRTGAHLETMQMNDEFQRAKTMEEWLSGDSSDEASHSFDAAESSHQVKPTDMTLSDLLDERNAEIMAASQEEEPNPITHPMLFFGQKGKKPSTKDVLAENPILMTENVPPIAEYNEKDEYSDLSLSTHPSNIEEQQQKNQHTETASAQTSTVIKHQ